MAGDHPTFSEADTDNDGVLNTQELAVALPELELQEHNPTESVTTADIQRLMPRLDLEGVEISTETEIGEEEYQQIVDAIAEQNENAEVSST